MSDRIIEVTQFISTSLQAVDGRKLMAFEDTGDQPIPRIRYLTNGTKVDMDGTADSSTRLGQYRAWIRCRGTVKGSGSANTTYAALRALRGKSGTLTGIARNSSGGTASTLTCTARLVEVRMRMMEARIQPAIVNQVTWVDADCVWERLTAWS